MKTKLLFNCLLFMSLLFTVACTGGGNDPEPEPPTPEEITYTLSADKYEVKIDEEVTFTVMSSKDEDVTDKWQICDDAACYGSIRKMKWKNPGTYHLKAQLAEDTNIITNKIEIKVTGSVYELRADKLNVFEREAVKFKVVEIQDGVELEKEPINFQLGIKDEERVMGMEMIFPTAGVYAVDAWKLNYQTGEIGVRTNTLEIIVKKKTPTGVSDNFYRRSLLSEYTATWCNTCPNMVKILEYADAYVLNNRFIVAAFHDFPSRPGSATDACNVEYTKPFEFMGEDFGFYSIPSYTVDWNKNYAVQDVGKKEYKKAAEDLSHKVEASQARYGNELTPGIALQTSLNGRDLNIKVKVTPREDSKYFLGLLFVEDKMETYQNGAPGDKMIQMNVVHKTITKGRTTRYEVDDLGILKANVESIFEYNLNDIAERYNLDNCRVIAYVCKADENIAPSGYFVSNTVTVKVGSNLDYEYEPVWDRR